MLPDEGRTRTASQSNSAAASNDGEHEAAPQEHVKVTAEETKEEAEGAKPQEREQKVKEARKESDAKEHRERDRRVLEKEKVQRERDRMERAHRERDRREEKRRERSKMDRKSTDAVRSHRAQKTWRDEKQDPDARRVRRDTTFYVCLHFCKMDCCGVERELYYVCPPIRRIPRTSLIHSHST